MSSMLNEIENELFMPAKSLETSINAKKIHIRYVKTGPRAITIIEGLDDDLDLERIAKHMKKKFNCAASIQKDRGGNDIIQLQGNQVDNVKKWLVKKEIIGKKEAEERIVAHGM